VREIVRDVCFDIKESVSVCARMSLRLCIGDVYVCLCERERERAGDCMCLKDKEISYVCVCVKELGYVLYMCEVEI
jgi:hypothetical protein